MKIKNVYVCDKCGRFFDRVSECEEHEATTHYSISASSYLKWKQLFNSASHAGTHVGVRRNPETVKAFEDAVKELLDFEEKHCLSGLGHPSNWY